MSYQTEEQQVEQLKEWWKENGTPLIVGAALGLSGFFGWKYWDEKQEVTFASASDLYMTVSEQVGKEDPAKLIENANEVKSQYPDSSYAILSAFHLAKQAVVANKLDDAVTELEWVVNKHKSNELSQIAKIRLARIYIAQQKAEQALSLLTFDKESGYFEMASLIKGDALMALDRKTEALEAYKAADASGKVTANHSTLKLMIEELTASELTFTGSMELADAGAENNMDAATDSESKTDTSKTDMSTDTPSETQVDTPAESATETEPETSSNTEASK